VRHGNSLGLLNCLVLPTLLLAQSGQITGLVTGFRPVAGGRGGSTVWVIDGEIVQKNALNNPDLEFEPPVESIQEMNVFVANYAATKPPRRYNLFGASLGGPVIKNRTFFFYNYEGLRIRQSSTVFDNVPTRAEVNGDFSASTSVIRDPETRQTFAGNVIPASRLDPVGNPSPNSARGRAAFGRINGLAAGNASRIVQLALRYSF
jgi:hypothetical protein